MVACQSWPLMAPRSPRYVFWKRLPAALDEAERKCQRVVLMLVAVDHIKQINDLLGHEAGNALLCKFAGQLPQSPAIERTV